jgi:tetratricopeptide (TPR) repeat protein
MRRTEIAMSTSPNEPAKPARSLTRRGWLIGVLLLVLVAGGVAGYVWWKKRAELPIPGSERYEQFVEAFDVGTAALDVGVTDIAETELSKAIELVSREPAAWANRGLLFIRTDRFPQAEADLQQAERLAPRNQAIEKLLGLLDQRRGKYTEAAAHFRKAIDENPTDIEALFSLAKVVNQEQQTGSDAEYQKLIERILALRPNNVRVLLERLKVALRRSDKAAVEDTLAQFRKMVPGWNELTRAQFAELDKKLSEKFDPDVFEFLTFSNVLKAEPSFQRSLAEIDPQDSAAGTPLRTFLRLAPVVNTPAPPDMDITFQSEVIEGMPAGRWDLAAAVWLTHEGKPTVLAANGQEIRAAGGLTIPTGSATPAGLIGIDWNNDNHTDLLAFGPAGLRFFQQGADGKFAEITAKTGLPADVLNADYAAAIAADYDLDGDIDIIIAPRTGPPFVLRNNFDGTFKVLKPFVGVENARAFAWADFDHDGASDLAVLDAKGKLQVFANERSGQFKLWPAALPEGEFQAFTVDDANDDGVLDLVVLRKDGVIIRISDADKRASWSVHDLARGIAQAGEPGTVRLFAADLDNNGVPDLLISGPSAGAAWLGSGSGKFEPLAAPAPPRIAAVADLHGTGRLDLIGLDAADRPVRFRNTGAQNFHYQTIRFRAAPIVDRTGDNRINSFGIGGEIEIRTGTFAITRPIEAPAVHFGLGNRSRASVIRIVWPNGGSQVEFNRPIDTTLQADQRLKGSCPFLFTWNGERFAFVADFMWSSPLGMYINGQDKGAVPRTTEWIRIRGDQLVPRDGHYDVRVNANLWETHFFDHLALHAVDHPPGTEFYCDERFALEPFTPAFHLMEPARPVARAIDHTGADATEVVRAVDGVYLDRAGRGIYQGISNDHWVEVDLGGDAPTSGPVWLVAHGWVHPTDSSVNYAVEQGTLERPRGLSLEVPDGRGGWKSVRAGIGFPAGKNKTVLLRLDGLGGPGVVRRFRLRTNMEIYWDALHYAKGLDNRAARKTELLPVVADLGFRGILAMSQANASSPELPDYDRIASRRQVWRDLIGYHTRYGDIRELIGKVDDRYAILNAGDDVALRFAAPPEPPAGWKRDFIWVSDGWEKDGDLNTRFGKTVLPLPWHGMPSYDKYTGKLADDPVYRRFKKDWDVFHTRYVSPTEFELGLRLK